MQVKQDSHYKQILRLLQVNTRVSSYELMRVSPRYSARVHEIRNDGYDVVRERDRGNIYRKPDPKMFWFRLDGRFEVNSRD